MPAAHQPPVPSRVPWELNPTPEILDVYIVEVVDSKAAGYQQPAAGQPHPNRSKYPGVLFCNVKPVDGSDRLVRWYWSLDYSNQDLYNYQITYSSEDDAYPIFARRYLVNRNSYIVAAKGSAFTGVYQIRVTNQGSGYTSPPAVAITGTGSGATAEALMTSDGKVGWVRITAEGSGFTAAPNVGFSGGGGSGAAATAIIQGAAKLVHQEVQPLPAEDPRNSLFVSVIRTYETIPGPALVGSYLDTEKGQMINVEQQVVAYGTTPTTGVGVDESSVMPRDAVASIRKTKTTVSIAVPSGFTRDLIWESEQDPRTQVDIYSIEAYVAAGTALPVLTAHTTIDVGGQTGLYIVYRRRKKFSASEDRWLLKACAIPTAYVDFPEIAVRFPGIYTFLAQFFVSFSFPYQPPFPGIHYTELFPRTNTRPVRATHYFTLGKPSSLPKKFTVTTPGQMSRMARISEDTVHPAFVWFVTVTDSLGNTTTVEVENIPASDPASYDPNKIYIFNVESHRWMGDIWEVVIYEASEDKNLTTFPPAQQGNGFTIGPYGGGIPESPDFSSTGFYAVNTNAGANAVSLFGFKGPTWTKLSGTTPNDAGLVDFPSGSLDTLSFITGNGTALSDEVEIHQYGVGGTSTFTVTATALAVSQVIVGFLNGDNTYNITYTVISPLTENIPAQGQLEGPDDAGGATSDGETATIGTTGAASITYTFKDVLSENIKATGSFAMSGNANDGDTVTAGSLTYLLQNTLTDVPYHVKIGASASATLDNLFHCINNSGGTPGTDYGNGGVANPDMTAAAGAGDTIDVTAVAAGTAGNDVTVFTTSTQGFWLNGSGIPSTHLSGGLAPVPYEVQDDATGAVSMQNLVAAINAGAGMGTAYSTGTVAHPQVTATYTSSVPGAADCNVFSKFGGLIANTIPVSETCANFSWVTGATLTGASAAVANEIYWPTSGSPTTAQISRNIQKALNGTGTAGVEYSTGTVRNPWVYVPTEVDNAAFTVTTRIPADWESYGSWQTNGNFDWSWDGNGAVIGGANLTISDISGAANGQLVGTLNTADHSLVMEAVDFDDPKLQTPNFPPSSDALTTDAILVGNRTAQIWFGQFGRMPLKYQKSVDGSTGWTDGAIDLNASSVYPSQGTIRKVGITDFAAASTYRYIRFVISSAVQTPGSHNYGVGNVSRLYLAVVWDI